MRILIASDKFKGGASSVRIAESIQNGLKNAFPKAIFDVCPLADGGEGTTEAIVSALGGRLVDVPTVNALAEPISAPLGLVDKDSTAIIEMSAAAGLAMIPNEKRNPFKSNTLGTGLMMVKALDFGCRKLVMGIGGSATNDGGLGVALALGYRFRRGDVLFRPDLGSILEATELLPPDKPLRAEIVVACDVDNPLLGPRGATRIYGPQKGVRDFEWFEARLEKLADLAERRLGRSLRDAPGAGAAGGLGFGLMAFAEAKLESGFDLVASCTGLKERVRRADLVITGEGRLDEQTLSGKGPFGVARLARSLGRKVVAVAGSAAPSAALHDAFDLVVEAKPPGMELAEAMRRTEELVAAAVAAQAEAIRRLTA
ncbi:MAG: glycerate kinase [Opitutales bacterium]